MPEINSPIHGIWAFEHIQNRMWKKSTPEHLKEFYSANYHKMKQIWEESAVFNNAKVYISTGRSTTIKSQLQPIY
jgi:hypothetical protein